MRYWLSFVGRVLAELFAFFWGTGTKKRFVKTQKITVVFLYGQNEIFLAGTKQEIPRGQDRPIFPARRTRPSDLMNILVEKRITFFNCGWFDFQHCSLTGIEVFFQIVHFFFIDMCCKSHCSKLLLRKAKCFSVLRRFANSSNPLPFYILYHCLTKKVLLS